MACKKKVYVDLDDEGRPTFHVRLRNRWMVVTCYQPDDRLVRVMKTLGRKSEDDDAFLFSFGFWLGRYPGGMTITYEALKAGSAD